MTIRYIKNIDTVNHTYRGTVILPNAYYQISESELQGFITDDSLISDIGTLKALIAKSDDGQNDLVSPSESLLFLYNGSALITTEAISSNITKDGEVLYTKIHGKKQNVLPDATEHFDLVVPYDMVYFQGAEIMTDIIGISDFHIMLPGTTQSIEQYGYGVNLGVLKYIRESKYAAKLPKNFIIRSSYTNDTAIEQEIGVNFILHEIRSS